MKKEFSKKEAQKEIDRFFEQKKLDAKNTKKIKRLSMKYKIRLAGYRKRFCKKCYADLKNGKVRVTKTYKSIECEECGFLNRWKVK